MDTIQQIEETMRNAAMTMAATRELDPNFVARLLKLGDRVSTAEGHDGVTAEQGQSILDKIRNATFGKTEESAE